MSKRMEKLTRIVARTLLLVFAFVVSVAQPAKGQSSTTEEMPFALLIEPIEGLTTARHKAPRIIALPVGTTLEVCHPLPERDLRAGMGGPVITWIGAEETHRTLDMSWAQYRLDATGEHVIHAIVNGPDGQSLDHASVINVVDVPIDAIHVRNVTVSVEPFDLDETATNEETLAYYFNENGFGDSIATLQPVGREHNRLRANKLRGKAAASTSRFRTSINRPMVFEIDVTPAEFAPLIEWRTNGQATRLGVWGQQSLDVVGVHTFSFGPPDRARTIEIETYEVQIISHRSSQDIVPDGQLVTFEAVTNPPGYEDDITWLSSTTYGTASPVLGYGPTFTVQFDNTFGDHPIIGLWQWLGVKADNTTFNQDEKCPGAARAAATCGGEISITCGDACQLVDANEITWEGLKVKVTWQCCPSGQCNGTKKVEVSGENACGVGATKDEIRAASCPNTEHSKTDVSGTVCYAYNKTLTATLECCDAAGNDTSTVTCTEP